MCPSCSDPVPSRSPTFGGSIGEHVRRRRATTSPAHQGHVIGTTRRAPACDSSTTPEPDGGAAYVGIEAPRPGYALAEVCPSIEAYARALFATFRRADALGLARIDAQRVPDDGLGRALMDRLQRAAEGDTVEGRWNEEGGESGPRP